LGWVGVVFESVFAEGVMGACRATPSGRLQVGNWAGFYGDTPVRVHLSVGVPGVNGE